MDSNGTYVGLPAYGAGTAAVQRRPNGDLVFLDVNEAGWIAGAPGDAIDAFGGVFYASNDCSGPPLYTVQHGNAARPARIAGTVAYYAPAETTISETHSDLEAIDARGCGLNAGVVVGPNRCCITSTHSLGADGNSWGPIVSFDLSTLGLVPPFHVEGQAASTRGIPGRRYAPRHGKRRRARSYAGFPMP